MAPRPDLEGQQFKHFSGTDFVYIVIDGILRWIPSSDVWNSLFSNWNETTMDLSGIDGFDDVAPPFPLPSNCKVVRGAQDQKVFMIDFQDHTKPLTSPFVKRWVQSEAAMAGYGFNWPVGHIAWPAAPGGTIPSTVVPQIIIDAVASPNPPGPLPLGAGLPGFPF